MLQLGLFGAGAMGRTLALSCQSLPEARLVAVASNQRVKAQQLADEVGAQACVDLPALLALPLDAIVIASLPSDHYQTAKACLAAGKSIFVEKPLCLDSLEAESLLRQAKSAGLSVHMAHSLRYFSPFCNILEAARQGLLGEVEHLAWVRTEDLSRGWRQNTLHSGGYWFEIGIHELDLSLELLSLCGQSANFSRCSQSGWQADRSALILEQDSQARLSYLATRAGPPHYEFRLRFRQAEFSSQEGFNAQALTIKARPEVKRLLARPASDPYQQQMQDWLLALRGEAAGVPVWQSMRVLRLLAALAP